MFDKNKELNQIAGNFEIILDAPNGAKLRYSGYALAEDTEEELNVRMDVSREVLMRQRNIMEKPIIENNLVLLKDQLEKQKIAYSALLDKNKQGKVASNEKIHLDNYPVQIKHMEEEIKKGEKKLSDIKSL